MNNKGVSIDLLKLLKYVLKRIWLPVIIAVIGFGFLYYRAVSNKVDMYAASGTMYIYNGNPNVINYQYTNSSDLNSAVQLLDTYMVVVKSNKVMDAVADRLCSTYPGITAGMISGTLSMGSVSQTGVMRVTCTTTNPQMSADICNAVLDVAPAEIIRVVSAGSIQIIDYAEPPLRPLATSPLRQGIIGGLGGGVAGVGILLLLFLLNSKITDQKDLEDAYTVPVIARIKREKKEEDDPAAYLLSDSSHFEKQECYAKLRMNLFYTLVGKESRVVEITSAISGEGKSTIAASLAVSCARGGKKLLLIDADLRRACQKSIFGYEGEHLGLTDVLVGSCDFTEAVIKTDHEQLDLLLAGSIPPNPAEMLASNDMKMLIERLNVVYDLVLIDVPPINIVSDPLVLSEQTAGCLFVVRQNYSNHREIKHALISAEMTGMNVLGFVFYGEKIREASGYYNKYYSKYYSQKTESKS